MTQSRSKLLKEKVLRGSSHGLRKRMHKGKNAPDVANSHFAKMSKYIKEKSAPGVGEGEGFKP